MPKVYKPKELVHKFQKLEFIEDRQSGSHKILYHPKTKTRVVIPMHLKEIPKGTVSAIFRESKVTKEKLDQA